MSNLVPWLTKRREHFYTGSALKDSIDSFLKMASSAVVYESENSIIVLEDYGFAGSVRASLLFDKFSRGVVRDIEKVTTEFKGSELYVSTHDIRMRNLMLRLGYTQYEQDANDFWLVKQGVQNGV